MQSLPTLSNYETEAQNNDNLAFQALNQAFPSLFQEDSLQTLLTVQKYVDLIRDNSKFGRVIVHISPGKLNIEYRGNDQPLRDS